MRRKIRRRAPWVRKINEPATEYDSKLNEKLIIAQKRIDENIRNHKGQLKDFKAQVADELERIWAKIL